MKKEQPIRALRYLPVVVLVLMTAHVGFLLCGVNECVTEMLMVCGGFYVVHCFSRALYFCLTHRIMIYYSYMVMACVWWQRFVGFGECLEHARLVMFLLGVTLIFIMLCRAGKSC